MPRRTAVLGCVLALSIVGAAPALASTKSERRQNAQIRKAMKTAKAAQKLIKSVTNTVKAILSDISSYGMPSPELGVVSVYAGNGPASPGSTAAPLQRIGTAWSGQIPRGGVNAGQTSGVLLYNCTGPAANPSAGCDVQLRAAIRTTRRASSVNGAVGGGFVITGLAGNTAVAGAQTGNGTSIQNDPVGAVGIAASPPTANDGTLLTFTPGFGTGVGIEPDHVTIHLQNPGLYEIQGTLQFFDSM